jgi:hypothetical protein
MKATFTYRPKSPGTNIGGYRYFFNGQEVDNEVFGEGIGLTAEFWQYDSRLGRRWNIDPVLKAYESPYACLAGNPVWLADNRGLDTSFANNLARALFNDTYKRVCDKINALCDKMERHIDKWSAKGHDNERINNRMARKIKELNFKRSKLNKIKDSFDEVINSTVMFHYTARPNPNGKYLSGGGTSYDVEGNRIVIWFYSGLYKSLIHETRHGAGFSWGEWGWNKEVDSPAYYDYQDEYEAYMLSNYYDRIILKGKGLSKQEIVKIIEDNYKNKMHIIKEFEQHCVPEK